MINAKTFFGNAELAGTYVKLEKLFVRDLLHSVSESPLRDIELAKQLGVAILHKHRRICITRWYYGGSAMPVRALKILMELTPSYSWGDVERNLLWVGGAGRGQSAPVKLKFPVLLDTYLGSLVGHILGDGSIDARYRQVMFFNSSKSLLKDFYQAAQHVFGLRGRIWLGNPTGTFISATWKKRVQNIEEIPNGTNCGLFYPTSMGLALHALCGQFALGKHKHVPEMAATAPTPFRIGLIRAFFDDEGTVEPASRYVRVFQNDSEILESIRTLLMSLGIEPGPVRSYIKRDRQRFYFGISGYDSLLAYQNRIGFMHPEKSSKLTALLDKLEKSASPRLRKGQTKGLLLELLKTRPATTAQLIAMLRVRHPRLSWTDGSVRLHLRQLQREGLVEGQKVNQDLVWRLVQ
jgi:hypothetical protein